MDRLDVVLLVAAGVCGVLSVAFEIAFPASRILAGI